MCHKTKTKNVYEALTEAIIIKHIKVINHKITNKSQIINHSIIHGLWWLGMDLSKTQLF